MSAKIRKGPMKGVRFSLVTKDAKLMKDKDVRKLLRVWEREVAREAGKVKVVS